MNYTELKMDADKIRTRVKELTANLQKNKGTEDLLGYGCKVVNARLRENAIAYLEYGPYWFALKEVLKRQGFRWGGDVNPELEAAYKSATDVETLVAAETFREYYEEAFMQGTRTFMVDGDTGEEWTLRDSYMERLAKEDTMHW